MCLTKCGRHSGQTYKFTTLYFSGARPLSQKGDKESAKKKKKNGNKTEVARPFAGKVSLD